MEKGGASERKSINFAVIPAVNTEIVQAHQNDNWFDAEEIIGTTIRATATTMTMTTRETTTPTIMAIIKERWAG